MHIPAPSAVACDKSQFRASARPPGGFLYREQSFLYKDKESYSAGFSACGGPLSRHISFPPQYPRFAGADPAIITFSLHVVRIPIFLLLIPSELRQHQPFVPV